jgi:hypothetical protein
VTFNKKNTIIVSRTEIAAMFHTPPVLVNSAEQLGALALRQVVPRQASDPTSEEGLSKRLGMAFPYDWSNCQMDETPFIRHVLRARRFDDVLKLVGYFGLERVSREVPYLGEPDSIVQVSAILSRIEQGMLLAQAEVPLQREILRPEAARLFTRLGAAPELLTLTRVGGLNLLNYARDYVIEGVKVTFFVHGKNKAQQAYSWPKSPSRA